MQRLKTRAQFQATLAGETISRTAHFALHRASLDAAAPLLQSPGSPASTGPESFRPQALFAVQDCWIGAMVPKRWAKRAVTRNAIKRQIYAVSADLHAQLPQASHVVRLRSGFDRKLFLSATSEVLKKAVRGELQQLFAGASAPSKRA